MSAGKDQSVHKDEDAVERKQAEEALRESEERFRLATSAGKVGVWDWDVVANTVTWSDTIYSIHGLEPGTFGGTVEAFAELVHVDDREHVNEAIQRALHQDMPYELEFRAVRPDGGIVWILTQARVMRDASGTPVRMLGAMVDITPRKKAELALRDNEERYKLVLAGADAAIWDWDVLAKTVLFSPRWKELRGLSDKEVSDHEREWSSRIHPDDLARVMAAVRAHFEGRTPVFAEEYRVRHTDGHWVWILDRGIAKRDASGRVVRMAGSETDVTERKEAEEALLEANRQKDEFLAMLSHELRNPLAPIASALQLLRLGQDDASIQQEALSALDRQVGALTRIVDDLLDVSRVTRRRIQLQQADVDLNALVQSVADSFRPHMAERQHQFSVSLCASPLWVHGDPIRLEQVVVNLLSNAAKYTPKGGRVWLAVMVDRGEALIRVKDSGMGIEAGLLPHIFELFSQGESTLDRTQGGLGIGLPLVKSLVEMHGGMVTAESKGPGKGSEFIVRLPTVPSPAPGPVTPQEDSGGITARSLRVLVVDDVADARKLFGRLLETLGNQVRMAHDGPSALEAALEFRPDVALLDIGLPGMNGYEVAQRMRQEPRLQNTVLVAITGYGQRSDRRRSEEAGFDHHLVKPLDIDALRQLLATIVETRM
jgi:PAS domain S-box-containing protein